MKPILFFFLIFSPLFSSENFLNIYVDSRKLDFSGTIPMLCSLARQESDCGVVGHAWVRVEGIKEGQRVYLEGGHSGDTGRTQPKYFNGIMILLDSGKEENPVRYLWEVQKDGFFEEGNGGHKATYAVQIPLTSNQFLRILSFIENYTYQNYSLVGNQCCSFAADIAKIAGLDLRYRSTLALDPVVYFSGCRITLWKDPKYSIITLASPDRLEQSLRKAVKEGKAKQI